MNRIGDIGLALAICLIYFEFKTLDYNIIFAVSHFFFNDFIFLNNDFVHIFTLINIFILIGAIGKSAQFGLHTWLPDAMAGPTPVSALIHAATMVTAGVFILIRSAIIVDYSINGLFFITLIGVFTAFFSSTIGLFQNDIKKIIAYSTCSQLGYMVFACGLSNYSLSLFHLTNHAFFKALLFLSAGSIIHALSDEQDIRKYGGLLKVLPFSYLMILIGSLSLMGIPFLTGFYSKDLIIEISFISYIFNNFFIY
jgi:NADH-ubiquinone oxidoreductase chain 5